jgi:hypothetical protein
MECSKDTKDNSFSKMFIAWVSIFDNRGVFKTGLNVFLYHISDRVSNPVGGLLK